MQLDKICDSERLRAVVSSFLVSALLILAGCKTQSPTARTRPPAPATRVTTTNPSPASDRSEPSVADFLNQVLHDLRSVGLRPRNVEIKRGSEALILSSQGDLTLRLPENTDDAIARARINHAELLSVIRNLRVDGARVLAIDFQPSLDSSTKPSLSFKDGQLTTNGSAASKVPQAGKAPAR